MEGKRETELTNMDLKSISARSLPYPHTLRKSSHLLSPKVLQIAWVRDVTKFRVEGFTRNTSSRRLLKLGLTDGHSEVAAVEYSHIPAIPDDVVPGTKDEQIRDLDQGESLPSEIEEGEI